MTRHPTTYRAYLLRVWRPAWNGAARASIREVESGEAHAFEDLDDLTAWLRAEVRSSPSRATPRSAAGHSARQHLEAEP